MAYSHRRRTSRFQNSTDQILDAACRAAPSFEQLEQRVLMAAQLPDWFQPQNHSLWNPGGFLTPKSTEAPLTIALNFMKSHATQLGLDVADVQNPIVVREYTDAHNGLTHIFLRQQVNGLEVVNGNAKIHVRSDGRILQMSSSFAGGIAEQLSKQTISPKMTATEALNSAASAIGIPVDEPTTAGRIAGKDRHQTLLNADLSISEIPTKLQYVALPDGTVALSRNMILDLPSGQHWYNLNVSDATAKVVAAVDYVNYFATPEAIANAMGSGSQAPIFGQSNPSDGSIQGAPANYNVFPMPVEAPNDGGRSNITEPNDVLASPFGWGDTDGMAGADSTITAGNNVSAQEDRDANNATQGRRADGGAGLNFDFAIDFGLEPTTLPNQDASITNLYYWNNILHDVHYKYGFTEAAANFQQNNYGRGGLQNDRVQADAQDGSGTNNANFATPADGSSGRMQMYLFTAPTPDRDGDLDAMVMAHEFGHGISNRLTNPSSGSLTATQSGGMGEGWADFYSLMFTQKPTDVQNQAYPVGTYVLNQPPTGAGIRRKPYSYEKTIDPLTWEVYGSGGSVTYPGHAPITKSTEVHNTGEIWCSALWDLNWLLINKYGYDSDLYTGYTAAAGPGHAGNKLTLQLVADGMKIQPNQPSFTQARDSILQADQALTGGANQIEIWMAFARRGLGFSASTASSSSTTVTVAFDIPLADPFVQSHTPSGAQLAPVSFVDIKFNQIMDQTSFSVVDDVTSFTGPGAADLKPSITGFSWEPGNTLRINFPSTTLRGNYSMTIGPNILAADDSNPMDQNTNGTPGEPADTYTATFSYNTFVGPEGFGYKAAAFPVESIDLVIGAPGVTTLINGSDDGAGTLALPAGNSFNYYGTTYTTLFPNANGMIAFGTSTTAFTNGDLTTTPSQATLAVLWDDWRTDQNTVGATDSAVLWKLDGGRLIVEWSDVPNRTAADGTATFQAILQLNTGAAPGRIIYNYPDITTNNATYSQGNSSTVGIKNAGTQGANRLVVSQNTNTHPFVATGQAILVALDVEAPMVTSTSFEFLTSHQIKVSFDDNVGASIGNVDLVLHNNTTNTTLAAALQAASYDGGTNTATFTVPGLPGSLLDDGDYTATLVSSGITDPSGNYLDGDANGTIGGDHTFSFFFLRGDANHDRTVNLTDFNILAANFGSSPRNFGQGDFNYDGLVNLADFNIFASRFGISVGPDGFTASSGTSTQPRVIEQLKQSLIPTPFRTTSGSAAAAVLGPTSSSSPFSDLPIGQLRGSNEELLATL